MTKNNETHPPLSKMVKSNIDTFEQNYPNLSRNFKYIQNEQYKLFAEIKEKVCLKIIFI